jgi:anti-sigma factor RsiW
VARFEERFKERLNQAVSVEQAPSQLRARISKTLQQRQVEQARAARWRWGIRTAFPAAAAALLLVTIGVTWLDRTKDDAPRLVAEQSVDWHRTELPLDVKASQEDRIRRYFRNKVPFAVRLPRLKDPNARLVGARLTQLRGHRAISLTYMVKGQRVSVFVVDPRALPAERQQQIEWRGVRGYNVGYFVDNDTGYAVTSDMDRRNLVKLISH